MISENEKQALALAKNSDELLRRLREAKSCLTDVLRKSFGNGLFDFHARQLVGDNGLILQWRTRQDPYQPESYDNQQTNRGTVVVVVR